MVDSRPTTPRPAPEGKFSFVSNLPKPLILCTTFAAGLFIASITFNLALYFSLRGRYSASLPPAYSPPGKPSAAMLGGPTRPGQPAIDIFNNIVMLEVHFATWNRCMPWQTVHATFQGGLEGRSSARASGLIVEPGLILTSAYVATDNYMITAMRQGASVEFEAEVAAVARDLNLALIRVKDASFFRDTDVEVALQDAAEILGRGNKITVAGFPVGGDLTISKLSSRVSRVEAKAAGFTGRYGSFPQTMLSVYPKIGGDITVGPVFSPDDNKLVGWIGLDEYVVPGKTIATFMKSFRQSGGWAGLGMLGMLYRSMQPRAMRMYWDLPLDDVGVQIRSVAKLSELRGQVEKGDMLVAIDGEPILSSGAIIHRKSVDNLGQKNSVAMPFTVLLGEKPIGDEAKLSFRRAEERENNTMGEHGFKQIRDFDVTVTMQALKPLAPRHLDEKLLAPPTYFMLGGLVFSVFTEDLVLQSSHFDGIFIPPATQAAALHRWRKNPDEQIVVLLRTLDHPCNKWYGRGMVRILKYFNGEEVVNMKQFVKSVGSALQGGSEFLKFAFGPLDDEDAAGSASEPDIVLDREMCTGSDIEIMMQHNIKAPASMDLKDEYMSLPKEFIQFDFENQNGSHPEPVERPRSLPGATRSPKAAKPKAAGRHRADESAPAERVSLRQLPWTNIVQIELVSAEQNFISPWKVASPSSSRCSAIIVNKTERLILTNSHCVGNAVSLDVLREDVPVPVKAKVVEIAHDVDLAWITTDDEAFWASDKIKETVSITEGLPYISNTVRVVGYPTGGSSITITQGIVSRIDGQIYPNGLMGSARNTPDNLLIVQVDAAINPGNSGGPVFDAQGNLVGLAFAVLTGSQNVGYVIPNVHLRNFIASVRSEEQGHRWQAQSEVGATFRNVENPGIRKFLHLKEDETGVQVRTISPFCPLKKNGIVKGDVLLKIDGQRVQGNGKVTRDINGKMVTLPFDTMITEKAHGTSSTMEFLHVNTETGERTSKVVTARFAPVPPLAPRFYDAPVPVKGREHFAAWPTYFILWGLVWGVFSQPVYQQAVAAKIDVPWSVKKRGLNRWLENTGDQEVVLLQGLGGSACTLSYDTSTMRIIDYFNGRKVKNIRDLVEYALQAEVDKEPFMRIAFKPLADEDVGGTANDPDIVLHRDFCATADLEVIQVNNIPAQWSSDVNEYANTAMQKAVKAAMEKKGLPQDRKPTEEEKQQVYKELLPQVSSFLESKGAASPRPRISSLLQSSPAVARVYKRRRMAVSAPVLDMTRRFSTSADPEEIGRNADAGDLDAEQGEFVAASTPVASQEQRQGSEPLILAQMRSEKGHVRKRPAMRKTLRSAA